MARADEDDLYHAMDWRLERQDGIETTLAARHLGVGAVARYDLSASSFEGSGCPLAQLGYSRDGRRASDRSTTACLPTGVAARWRRRSARRPRATPRRAASKTARRHPAFAPCRTNSAPSCVTPAAPEAVATMRRASRSSPRRTPHRRGHSNCSKPSRCSQNNPSAELAYDSTG